MATASDSQSGPIQAQRSPRIDQLRRSSGTQLVPGPPDSYPPLSLSGTVVDQEQFVTNSSMTSFDSFPSKEASPRLAPSSSLAEDGNAAPAGADAQLDNSENGCATKKPAWNKTSNGVAAEVGVVMGAESWPALSESARASPKFSSTYSPKALSHGPITTSEGMAAGSQSPQKEDGTSVSTPNSTSNRAAPTRQRSMKRGGSSNRSSKNGSLSQALPIQGGIIEAPPPNTGKPGGSVVESYRENAHRDDRQRGGSYGGNEVRQQPSSFRSNSGPQPRGDGSYHQNHGVRRDPYRNFGGRENRGIQQSVSTRPFIRGPAPNAPFISPPPPPLAVQPIVSPMVYAEMPSHVFYVSGPHPDSLRAMPMLPVSPTFYMPEPHLSSKILNQIDYYFSNDNLVRDTFLRQNMDGEGWVSIKLIAGFKKVMQLTDNIQLIQDAIQSSNVVEVQGDKVRRKSDWNKWIMPPAQYSPVTSPQSIRNSSQDTLAAHLNSFTLDEK